MPRIAPRGITVLLAIAVLAYVLARFTSWQLALALALSAFAALVAFDAAVLLRGERRERQRERELPRGEAREHVRQNRDRQQDRDPARRDARHLFLRRANARQDARHDVVGRGSVQLGFGTDDEAMREDQRRDVLHVVGADDLL